MAAIAHLEARSAQQSASLQACPRAADPLACLWHVPKMPREHLKAGLPLSPGILHGMLPLCKTIPAIKTRLFPSPFNLQNPGCRLQACAPERPRQAWGGLGTGLATPSGSLKTPRDWWLSVPLPVSKLPCMPYACLGLCLCLFVSSICLSASPSFCLSVSGGLSLRVSVLF